MLFTFIKDSEPDSQLVYIGKALLEYLNFQKKLWSCQCYGNIKPKNIKINRIRAMLL